MKTYKEYLIESAALYFIYSDEFDGNATNTSTRDLNNIEDYAKSKNLNNYVVVEYKDDVYKFVKVVGTLTNFIKKIIDETEKTLDDYKTSVDQLNSGKIKPAKVGGSGATKKGALAWLDKNIRMKETFLNSFKAALK